MSEIVPELAEPEISVEEPSASISAVGRRVLPILERLVSTLPSVATVVVSTADGFNVCALGLDEQQVERVCALGSSLHSMAGALTEAIAPGVTRPLDLTSIAHGEFTTVVLAISLSDHTHLLLWVTTSEDTTMGSVIYRARETAAAIQAELDSSRPAN
jgi:predicted regulator of Ras-like GTPase activity (Roadblock/LC7/MglB family)